MPRPSRNGQVLSAARALVERLEAGDAAGANRMYAELGFRLNDSVYHQMGRLTRELHDSLKTFLQDEQLADLAEVQIPNAAERLRYVVRMTEQAANKTLTSVEKCQPLAEQLSRGAGRMEGHWERCAGAGLSVEDCQGMSSEMTDFCLAVKEHSEALRRHLADVQMAQGFQDLTGQIIVKVITLVGDIEEKMVGLIRLVSDQGAGARPGAGGEANEPNIAPQGPAVPGVDRGGHASDQDEVDDILSNLGF